ncbi:MULTISPECIES: CopG family transcriptional regulator [unclassified Adlercreutzia]|uniref:ribbon-helix-helix domain-containing protein n=1 Tax=unclassified Adlercreutzia TaxID=2636013 RepID=UPI0013EAFBB9|nr:MULTISPECIES: CopG family transcriptional regulator [unclassified Adlercreutzia]
MSDRDLCEMFGTTLEEVEADAEKHESGDFSSFDFGKPIDGRPTAKMRTTSLKLYDFQLKAIDKAAEKEGVSRSEFVRRAIDNELVALA